MSILERVHTAGVNTIVIGYALLRIALGLLMIGGCVWAFSAGLGLPGLNVIFGMIIVWGLVMVVMALGMFVGAPAPERNAQRETRKALRRARMMRRW
jgi:hypothetical protein